MSANSPSSRRNAAQAADQAHVVERDGQYRIEGVLSFGSVPELANQSRDWFEDASAVVVDLDGVTRSDSAGVALLLDWRRRARAAGGSVGFNNPPPQMRAIVALSGLDQVLDFEAADAV